MREATNGDKAQNQTDITADARALQERDDFIATGWTKAIAPAKVNLHLAIGNRRADGYHEVTTVFHTINLHDVVYMRRKLPDSPEFGTGTPNVRMVSAGDVQAPAVPSEENLVTRAILKLAGALGRPEADADLEVRIEKNIPSRAGLGGGSSDAAAALIGSCGLWGVLDDSCFAACESVARDIGADVAFFLRGGCAYYEGAGDLFVKSLTPSKRSIVLVKPEGGISTADAYRAFDETPRYADSEYALSARNARSAEDILPFNNLAEPAESLMPELAEIRTWLTERRGAGNVLLCGSGATSFAVCDDFASACAIVAEARKRGWWARATSFGSIRALIVSEGGAS